jgi:hypothetical protein
MLGGAMIGAIAASYGGGVAGYGAAFMVVGLVMLLLTLAALGLKGRAAERATARRDDAAHASQPARS